MIQAGGRRRNSTARVGFDSVLWTRERSRRVAWRRSAATATAIAGASLCCSSALVCTPPNGPRWWSPQTPLSLPHARVAYSGKEPIGPHNSIQPSREAVAEFNCFMTQPRQEINLILRYPVRDGSGSDLYLGIHACPTR